MNTQMLIGSKFEKGSEAAETILNPKTGETILFACRSIGGADRRSRLGGGRKGIRHLVAHHTRAAFRRHLLEHPPSASRPRPGPSPGSRR